MIRGALVALACSIASTALAAGAFPPASVPASPDVAAVAAGRAWSVSTGIVQVPANDELDVVLTNPSASNCSAMFVLRRLSNPNGVSLAFQSFINPAPVPGGTALNPGNRLIGSAPASGLSFSFGAQAQGSMSGTGGVKAPLLQNFEEDITVPTLLLPGRSYGLAITALSGLLSNAIPLSVTIGGYCQ